MKVVVIIPAAGLGTRMAPPSTGKKGDAVQTVYRTRRNADFIRTLRKFAACREVSEICVALRADEIGNFRSRLEKDAPNVLQKNIQFVEGGEHRQHSVANALAAIRADADDIILVHDAVRPFVSDETIQQVIHAVQKHNAAIAGIPAVDTVKQVERTAEGAVITATLPRERVVLAQTPQGFRYGLLKKVFDEAAADGFMGTDEASLVERSGHPVVVVMGSPKNLKITTPGDLELAEFLLNSNKP